MFVFSRATGKAYNKINESLLASHIENLQEKVLQTVYSFFKSSIASQSAHDLRSAYFFSRVQRC